MNLINTNLLPPSLTIPKPIIFLAKFTQFFSTHLTAKFAALLFSTPVKFPIPKREKVMLDSAQKKTIFVESIGKNIEVLSYGYSQKKVLLVHGWVGRSTRVIYDG
ncbi:hypothetical protein PJW08_08840 [Tenacibaculum finnmarkense]|nr:hypothetical protein PJW08_08840 [Tenacibaculum finnmarkense]